MNFNDEDLFEKIWKDANFQSSKKVNETSKIKKVKDNFYVSNCKICNIEIKLPCTYNGNYPLCIKHRDPNQRP